MQYGAFYGPGAIDDQVELVPGGSTRSSGRHRLQLGVHLDDAASATVLAVEQKARGVFNIVDDEPAPASEWLLTWPRARGEAADAGPHLACPAAGWGTGGGDDDRGRGLYAKAKRELGWELRYPSWRQGFPEELA